MSDDYIRTVLEFSCQQTGRLVPSHLDYQQVQQWQQEGIPLDVVKRGILEKVQRGQGKKWLRYMLLEWADADVREWYDIWKRGVGSHVAQQIQAEMNS